MHTMRHVHHPTPHHITLLRYLLIELLASVILNVIVIYYLEYGIMLFGSIINI